MANRQGSVGPDILDNNFDLFKFGLEADTTHALAGDDTVATYDDGDMLYGGAGLDDLYGGIGNDQLFGGLDKDRLYDGQGNDTVRGGGADDLIFADVEMTPISGMPAMTRSLSR